MSSVIETYYTAHRDELLAFVSSRLRGDGEAEDIVQNVFLRLLTSGQLISEVTLPALVYTMARRLIIDYYRRRCHRDDYEHELRSSAAVADSAESVLSVREVTESMERGLARVPENCREVYRLHVYEGMKVSEISQALGEGYKSVEHRLGTARKAVRQYMRKVS